MNSGNAEAMGAFEELMAEPGRPGRDRLERARKKRCEAAEGALPCGDLPPRARPGEKVSGSRHRGR